MNSSHQRWESRHREAASHAPPEPAAFLIESFPLLPPPHPRSRALDLACGAGQNAVWLAERNWPVVAVDFAPAALDRAATLAASRGLPVNRRRFPVAAALGSHLLSALPDRFSGLLLAEADLESSVLPESAFDLILCFQYLHRCAFPAIERALTPGGFLLYETFTEDQRAFADGPRSPEHLLARNELRSAFPNLETLFYREYSSNRAQASLLASKR
jgi:tellurite methyltransferase